MRTRGGLIYKWSFMTDKHTELLTLRVTTEVGCNNVIYTFFLLTGGYTGYTQEEYHAAARDGEPLQWICRGCSTNDATTQVEVNPPTEVIPSTEVNTTPEIEDVGPDYGADGMDITEEDPSTLESVLQDDHDTSGDSDFHVYHRGENGTDDDDSDFEPTYHRGDKGTDDDDSDADSIPDLNATVPFNIPIEDPEQSIEVSLITCQGPVLAGPGWVSGYLGCLSGKFVRACMENLVNRF